MLGYLKTNSTFYKGNHYLYNLEKAIAASGGSNSHYEFFRYLLSNSLWNTNNNSPIFDMRAAQSLLYLFPIRVQIILSIFLYIQERNLADQFNDYQLTEDISLPSTQLKLNSFITKNYIANELLNSADEIALLSSNLNDTSLRNLKKLLNITVSFNDFNGTLSENLALIFNKFRIPNISSQTYINIANINNRLNAGIITMRNLKYKKQSIVYFTQAHNIWSNQISNT